MQLKPILAILLAALFINACATDKNEFLITNGAIGPLKKDSPIKAVDSLFANDSIVKLSPLSNALGTQGQVEIYDREGNKLLLISPDDEKDPNSLISDVLVFDTRYATKAGFNPGSTFKDLKAQYEIKAVENAINAVIVFLKDSDIWVTIDKKQLPEEIRYNFNAKVEATQIPDEATFKYFMIGWNNQD
jgi:hypothetical protein